MASNVRMNIGVSRPLALALATLVVPSLTGCDDGKKAAEQSAVDVLAKLVPVMQQDVGEVRRGLPEGVKKLGPMLDPDTVTTPILLQKTISRTRALVPDLDVAKGTFFTITDTTGTSLRSEVDPDLLAGKSMIAAFPPLKKALDSGGTAEAWGEMQELRGVRKGPDLAWIEGAAVKDDHGKTMGLFVTGWSLRLYAKRLEYAAQNAAREAAEKTGKKNPSLVYVFIVKGKTAYGTPVAPDVNAQAIEALDPVAKTATGPYRGNLEITNRPFGVALTRVPDMDPDVVLATLATEI